MFLMHPGCSETVKAPVNSAHWEPESFHTLDHTPTRRQRRPSLLPSYHWVAALSKIPLVMEMSVIFHSSSDVMKSSWWSEAAGSFVVAVTDSRAGAIKQ